MKIYIVIIIILVLIIVYLNCATTENFTNFHAPCGPTDLLGSVMSEYDMKQNKNDWEYYIPCEYNTCEKKVTEFENEKNAKKLYMIDGCDVPASKMDLWNTLKKYYKKDAIKYMPETYLLYEEEDMKNFKDHFNNKNKEKPNHMFIMKNYAQRQEGIKIVTKLDDILDGYSNGFYLVQDYLYKPYLVNKRKVNFRYYTLIVCRNGIINGYIHRDGFVYYTPEFYDENSNDFNKHITTGYIDRKVYAENPLTLDDFRDHLNKSHQGLSHIWDQNVKKLMYHIVKALSSRICKNKKLFHHTQFQLFGSDVAPTENLDAFLMEINKGPDLDAKDERDKKVKLTVQRDIFKIIENNLDTNNRFEKIF